MKKIRRIRMTTRTSKLVVVRNKTASPEAPAATADGHSHAEICPTCGQPLLLLQPTPAVEQKPLLPPPATTPAIAAVVCLNEHEADET